jgi:biotin transport system substrate-specific component
MKSSSRTLVYCALMAALIAVGAWLSFPLPPFPGKLTLQLVAVFLCAYTLPPKPAAMSILVYITLGLVGVPLFSEGGGLQYLLRPTFGYVLGFLAAAPTMSWMLRAPRFARFRPLPRYALSATLGLLVVYAMGTPYMAAVLTFSLGKPTSLWTAFYTGCVLFLPVDIAKAAMVYPAGRLLQKNNLTL